MIWRQNDALLSVGVKLYGRGMLAIDKSYYNVPGGIRLKIENFQS